MIILMIYKNLYLNLLILAVFSFLNLSNSMARQVCIPATTDVYDLVKSPNNYKGQKIYIEGSFHSFTTLPLDYSKAYRDSKDYIGIMLSRPDFPEIPLVELKLAVPLSEFKDENKEIIENGDKVRIEGEIYAIALGEPWLEVKSINKVDN